MGQKVNPNGFRIGVIRDWNTRWYASKKDFADFLVEDHKIREFVKKKYYAANISRIGIDRAAGKISVSIFTARPGMLIGKGGAFAVEQRADLFHLIFAQAFQLDAVFVAFGESLDAEAQLFADAGDALGLPGFFGRRFVEDGHGPAHTGFGGEGAHGPSQTDAVFGQFEHPLFVVFEGQQHLGVTFG